MGIGKSTICQKLNELLDNSVFLDGDWCWNMDPFIVNEETKKMVVDNITHCLNNFIHTSNIENIVFCWVMHKQEIIDDLLEKLDLDNIEVDLISLVCEKEELIKRMLVDRRKSSTIKHSLEYLELYKDLNTRKLDITNLVADEVVDEIKMSS